MPKKSPGAAKPPSLSPDLKRARELCTEPEFELVVLSQPASLRSMTPRLVRSNMERARGLRDKFRRNAATATKAKLFEEVLRRFEGRAAALDLLESGESRGMGRPRTSKARASVAEPSGADRVQGGRARRRAADAREETKLKTSPLPVEQWHAASRGRRRQAQRDAR